MVGFLVALVERGLFDSIELGFLPVGHTHDEIDSWFSRIARTVSWRFLYQIALDSAKGWLQKSPGAYQPDLGFFSSYPC